jgi:hypothetical protein
MKTPGRNFDFAECAEGWHSPHMVREAVIRVSGQAKPVFELLAYEKANPTNTRRQCPAHRRLGSEHRAAGPRICASR